MKKITILLVLMGLLLSGCSQTPKDSDETTKEEMQVVQVKTGDYSILMPFSSSILRQDYGSEFREVDMLEIGYQLLEMTKGTFDPSSYYIAEGSVIDRSRYHELVSFEDEDNPSGLNISKDEGFTMSDKTVLKDPRFVSDIVEIDYYKSTNTENLDGIAVALVLKRVQTLDASTGLTYRMTDDDLFTIGSVIGLRLQAYLRSIDGLVDVPMFVGLYVQESDVDTLPGKYLPGYYIGHSYSVTGASEFERDNSQWYFISSSETGEMYPQLTSTFTLFKNSVMNFINGENTSVVGKAYINGNTVEDIQIQITTGAKTYVELYAITQYVASILNDFDTYDVSVNIQISNSTRFVITKNAKEAPIISKIV